MDTLGEVIQEDILRFLDERLDPKLDRKRIIRDEEFTIFDFQKDYSKELDKALSKDDLNKAKVIFNEVKTSYDKLPEEHHEKKKTYYILKELHDKIRSYIGKKEKEKNIDEELNDFEKNQDSSDLQPPSPPDNAPQENKANSTDARVLEIKNKMGKLA
jgi:hypothetical protein